MKSIILASGFGTRLYPLTLSRAKALLPYKGKPVIDHIVAKIPPHIEIMVNTNKKFEAEFRRWQDTIDREITICVEPVYTQAQALGAVGSLDYWIREKDICEDLLVIGGDNYFEFSLEHFIGCYDGKNVLVAVYDVGDKKKAKRFGVVRLKGNRIVELEEKPKEPKSTLVATACWLIPGRALPLVSEFCCYGNKDNLGNFIAHLAGKEEVHAYVFNKQWLDIGSNDTYHSKSR